MKVFRLDLSAAQASKLVDAFNELIARNITHPAIAAPIAAGLDGTSVYLVAEHAVGESLEIVGPTDPKPLSEVVPGIETIAAAIDAAADRGVRHGLLHPRDIIITPDGPRVTGFGVADAVSSIGLKVPARRPYAAPEGPSDIYALAAIAYELISGRRMTPGGWDELSAEDGPDLRNAFAAALSEDPNARPRRAGEFAAKLREAMPRAMTAQRAGAPSTPPHPEVDRLTDLEPVALDRFTDLEPVAQDFSPVGDAAYDSQSDLTIDQIDEPAPLAPPFPPSWNAQPPKAFQAEEIAARSGRVALPFVLSLIAAVVVIGFGGAYLLKSGILRGRSATSTQSNKNAPVTTTTVDLPASAPKEPQPAPQISTMPAPAPSTKAPGNTESRPIVKQKTDTGRLLIRSTPAGASVLVDGRDRGETPLTLRDLPLGSYTIRVAHDGFAAADRRVRLTAKRPAASFVIPLKAIGKSGAATTKGVGTIAVESRPAGARVFVNDRLIGKTPLAVPDLPAGPAKVRIEMDGYQTWATTTRVAAGERTRVAASLDRK